MTNQSSQAGLAELRFSQFLPAGSEKVLHRVGFRGRNNSKVRFGRFGQFGRVRAVLTWFGLLARIIVVLGLAEDTNKRLTAGRACFTDPDSQLFISGVGAGADFSNGGTLKWIRLWARTKTFL